MIKKKSIFFSHKISPLYFLNRVVKTGMLLRRETVAKRNYLSFFNLIVLFCGYHFIEYTYFLKIKQLASVFHKN